MGRFKVASDNTTISHIKMATACSDTQAQDAVDALIELGWRPPADWPTNLGQDLHAPLACSSDAALVVHTDGACSGNPGPGGWAAVFSLDGTIVAERSGGSPATTNNRMELVAIREALRLTQVGQSVQIVTDSQNAIGWLSGGWKRKDAEIAALCREIDGLMAERPCSFSHVLGHNGDAMNERADHLATSAVPR